MKKIKSDMLDGVRAIFFDAGGTLLYPHPSVGEVYARVAAEYGVAAKPEVLNKIFHEVWDNKDGLAMAAFQDEKSERKWWREIVHAVFSQVGEFQDFEVFFDDLYHRFASAETWRLFDETHAVLEHFKSRGYTVGLISNWDRRLLPLCDALDIKKYFDFMLVSALYGKAKPHQAIFNEALRLADVKPEQALHVGDSLEDDVRGAISAGIRALWLNRHERGHHKTGTHSVSIIKNLSEMTS